MYHQCMLIVMAVLIYGPRAEREREREMIMKEECNLKTGWQFLKKRQDADVWQDGSSEGRVSQACV